jgi:hypothetical protein
LLMHLAQFLPATDSMRAVARQFNNLVPKVFALILAQSRIHSLNGLLAMEINEDVAEDEDICILCGADLKEAQEAMDDDDDESYVPKGGPSQAIVARLQVPMTCTSLPATVLAARAFISGLDLTVG